MASTSREKLYGQCRCCLKIGYHRDIMKCYYRNGKSEMYRDMLLDCFNIFLSTSPNVSTLICMPCVNRLVDALEFRTMVVESEQHLHNVIGKHDTLFINVPDHNIQTDVQLKEEVIKDELIEYDMDEDVGDHSTDDFNTEPVINGEDTDQELANDEAALTARFSKNIRRLPNRASLHTICPNYVKQLDFLKDKKVNSKTINKLLDIDNDYINYIVTNVDYSEKAALVHNCAVLLENSNLTPFKSMKRNGFPCFYCRHVYDSLEKIREHQLKSHKKDDLRPLLKTNGPESLIVYVDTTDLKCTICNVNIPNINELKSHLVKVHHKMYYDGYTDRVVPFKLSKDNIYLCQICGFSLETFGSIERHMNMHYSNYICQECGTGFVTKYRLKVHSKSMHVEGSYPCGKCHKIFTSTQKLKNHINTVHESYKRFKCPKCMERFTEYFKRQKHMVEKHGVAPLEYKCNVCDKSFDRRYTLSRHMKRDHLVQRDFQCDMCSYNCFTNNELRVHMIKHNGERIFECSVCKKSYARKKTLREHMRIHNNDRRFACAACGQAFVQKCSLKGHIKTHHMEYEHSA